MGSIEDQFPGQVLPGLSGVRLVKEPFCRRVLDEAAPVQENDVVGQATGPRAGRMVRAARGKLALLRSKVILVGAEGAVVFLVAVFFMVANEGRIRR